MLRDRLVFVALTIEPFRNISSLRQEGRGACAGRGNGGTESAGTRSEASGPSGRQLSQEVHKTSPSGASPTEHSSKSSLICYRCGLKGHTTAKCKVDRDIVCHHCHKRGHMRRACKSKSKPASKPKPKSVDNVQDEEEGEEEEEKEEDDSTLNQVKSRKINAPPIMVKVKLDDCLVDMEVDTGASVSLISEDTFKSLWPGRTLQPSPVRLRTYLKETIPVVGSTNVNVDYNGQLCGLPLVVVGGSGPALMGRDWLSHIQLDWRQVHNASLHSLLSRHRDCFHTRDYPLVSHLPRVSFSV